MLYLARHGQTLWNLAGRYQGRLESPLSELGRSQADALARFFGERAVADVPGRVVASPLGRCLETARPASLALGLELESDARLVEIAHGTWQGRFRDELAASDPERYRMWREDPAHVVFEGGESLAGVLERWRDFAREFAREPRDVLVVTHDAVLRCALVDARGATLDDFWKARVENGAYAMLRGDGTRFELVQECVTSHLAGLRAPLTGQAL